MSNLTINVGSMIVHGVSIGNRAMDASNNLRLYEPDEGQGSRDKGQDNGQTRLVVAEVLRQLREGTPVIPPPLRVTDPQPEAEAPDARTTSPGVNQMVTLRQVYDDLHNRAKDTRTKSSWSGYRTLLRYWERYHECDEGGGPCVTSIDREALQEFFLAVPEWHSHRSWERNRDLMFALLRSCCAETNDNEHGRPKGEAVLIRDDLPVWKLPPERWFRDRPKVEIKGKQKRGGHRKRKIPLLKVDEFGKVLKACDKVEFMSPLWWRTWLSLLWFNGHRFEDSLSYQWDEGPLHIDLQHKLLDFTETKRGGETGVPIPSWLFELLTELREAQGNPASGEPVFAFAKGTRCASDFEPDYRLPRGDLCNRHRRLDPEYRAIFERAGVPIRHPHELRGASITYWTQHAPEYRFAATGHKPPKADTQLRSYVILDEKFYAAAESFPYPGHQPG